MNRIILIGNGFDLAHELDTSYKHFIEYLCKKIFDEIRDSGKNWEYEKEHLITLKMQYRSDRTNGFIDSQNSNLEDVLNAAGSEYQETINRVCYNHGLPKPKDDNIRQKCETWTGKLLIFFDCLEKLPEYSDKYKNEIRFKQHISVGLFFRSLLKAVNLENWVDIEEMYYAKLLDCAKKNSNDDIKMLNNEFERIKNELEEYLHNISKEFEIKKSIIHNIIEKLDLNKDYDHKLNMPENILFLNFNYTDTAQKYIKGQEGIIDENYIKPCEIIYVHGQLKTKDNPIIFGYGDETMQEYLMIENLNNNDYLDNMKTMKYLETDNYTKLLDFINSGEYQVFIFGHSCGKSDKVLLKMLFENENCVSIKPFYYKYKDDRDVEKDNYSDIVKNISRHFSDKAIMRKKIVNKKYCSLLVKY